MEIVPLLTIVGTSHISKKSAREVEKEIREKQPDVVAVELDRQRFFTLFHPNHSSTAQSSNWKMMKTVGIRAFIFMSMARKIQKKIGSDMGMLPGSEMKKAIQTAAEVKAKVALVDQHILVTAKKINKVLGWRIFWRMMKDAGLGMFKKGQAYKLLSSFNIENPTEQNVKQAMQYLHVSFPQLYQILLEERNEIMFKRVEKFLEEKQRVVLVVGMAHKEGIQKLFQNYTKE